MMKKLIWILSLAGLVAAGCRRPVAVGSEGRRGGGVAVAVLVGTAERRDVGVGLGAIGRVVPVASVSVKSQVTGKVLEVHFEEGEEVGEGEKLVTIDPQPFEVARGQALAELAEAESRSANAQDQARRYSELNRTGGASKEQTEQYVTSAQQSAAQVESARAAVQKAELELAYCTIRSAIRGRAGRHLVTAGNVVTANTTDLVVLNQTAPIDVIFAVPEQHLAALRAGMRAGSLKVTATGHGPEGRVIEGRVRFLDNEVRPGSGTIDVKAGFANEPAELWPGQFVTVAVELGVEKGVVVVPAAAVQSGQAGAFVFVVEPEETVSVRPVKVGRVVKGEALIMEGLEGGEKVVTDGHGRLARGTRVLVKESLKAAAEDAITATRPRP